MKYKFLENINSSADLKKLSRDDIPVLNAEIRAFLVENVERTGGHLASNLGVTELTVAVHRIFDSPRDHVVFDVGHQAYIHKLITGRRDRFDTLRTPGGLSGFTQRRESEHDPFGAGHSSTSLSAALGFAEADALAGSNAHTVCILGDGAYTGGMIHEALNNCKPELKMVIILNENGMSISHTRGRFTSLLSRVRISARYTGWKQGTTGFLERLPLLGKPIKRFLTFVKTKIKGVIYSPNYFEQLGLYYIGPIDGNDYAKVEKALADAKRLGCTVVVHLKTKKGKGYEPAELSPDGYHSVTTRAADTTFHSVFADELISQAERDTAIVAVTAAMGIGTGLDSFGKRFPQRYYDVGIAEEHAVTFSAGLAAGGLKPFVAIYSTFLQRAYDSILHDVALQSLPVRLIIDRAGLSVGDGATHHGIFDVAFLSHIPGIDIYAPITYASLRSTVAALAAVDRPAAIRYPNAAESPRAVAELSAVAPGVLASFDAKAAPEHVFITYGSLTERVLSAADILRERGLSVGVVAIENIKPYRPTAELLVPLLKGARRIVFAEEGIKNGGAAMIYSDTLSELGLDLSGHRYGIAAIDDDFVSPTEPCDLYEYAGLSPELLARRMTEYD